MISSSLGAGRKVHIIAGGQVAMYREFVKWLNEKEIDEAQDFSASMSEFLNLKSSQTGQKEWEELKHLVMEIRKFSRVTNNRPEVKKVSE